MGMEDKAPIQPRLVYDDAQKTNVSLVEHLGKPLFTILRLYTYTIHLSLMAVYMIKVRCNIGRHM